MTIESRPPFTPADGETRPTVRSLAELSSSGLLWLINAAVFHPRGVALAISIDPTGEKSDGWYMVGSGASGDPEPWSFEPGPDIDAKFLAAAETIKSAGGL
jgi:hypothetical protein